MLSQEFIFHLTQLPKQRCEESVFYHFDNYVFFMCDFDREIIWNQMNITA